MPLLLILLLVASVWAVDWPAAAVPYWAVGEGGELVPAPFPAELTVAATAGMVLLSTLTSFAVSLLTARTLRKHPDRRSRASRRYGRWRVVAFYLNLAVTAVAIFAFGWGHWVQATFRDPHTHRLLPFAELLVPGPYLLTLAINWLGYWPAERALARAAHPNRPFWSLFAFWVYNARQFVFPVFLMVLINVTHQSVGRMFPVTTHQWWFQLAMLFAAVGFAAVLPLFLRPLLGLQRLPAGPVRDRLEATARRLGVSFSDLLLWPTRGAMANAMVVGVIPWARYVIFTDRLLDGLEEDELDAVFGHEVGHARYGHLPYYLLFLLLSTAALTGAVLLADAALGWTGVKVELPDSFDPFVPLPPLAVMGLYLFVVFGWLSRVCERQADIFGSRAGSCNDPGCRGHTADTVLAARGRGLCPTGLRSMARALERVMALNGWDGDRDDGSLWRRVWRWVRAWQHGPMAVRVNYLLGLTDRPQLADRHDRKAFFVRLFLALGLLAVATAGVLVAGRELLNWL